MPSAAITATYTTSPSPSISHHNSAVRAARDPAGSSTDIVPRHPAPATATTPIPRAPIPVRLSDPIHPSTPPRVTPAPAALRGSRRLATAIPATRPRRPRASPVPAAPHDSRRLATGTPATAQSASAARAENNSALADAIQSPANLGGHLQEARPRLASRHTAPREVRSR